ncbi:hypothetical protein VTN00DRAFT_3415 [Thermoascus crustaceus]|uniref:uncharacterized protein n=1 Tax=Thermoascus crustaceus TaxID=5088 RepID=UPI0037441E56
MSMTTGAVGLSIGPQLNFRAVVSSDSPAFKLFSRKPVFGFEPYPSDKIDFIGQQLYQLFCRVKAAPSDVTPDGETILHVICEWVGGMERASSAVRESYSRLLTAVAATGEPLDERDNDGNVPLDILIRPTDVHSIDGRLGSFIIDMS